MDQSTPPLENVVWVDLCFVSKVCCFAIQGVPLGLQELTSGFAERSPVVDEGATAYHPYVIIRPVIRQKRVIDPKGWLDCPKV